LFKKLPFKIIDPSEEDITKAGGLINLKDAQILAAAISGKVDWLLSLDKHFLREDRINKVNFKICAPGEFLQTLWFLK
jgi:predicted nucleic acid-binding protein